MGLPLRNGRLNKRQILTWFDPSLPKDLPEHVVDKLLEGFWASEAAHRGYTDETYGTSTPEGWNVRLDTLNKRMWFASGRTVAKYRAASRLDLTSAQAKRLRPWERAAWEATNRQRLEAKKLAKDKADTLLSTLVSPKMYQHYLDNGELLVASKLHPGTVYILHQGVLAGNIDVYDKFSDMEPDAPRAVICSSPVEDYPNADLIVAQLLHIRADETHFLQLANLHTGTWSEQEQAVRDARTFHTVPRYDQRMGGWVNVPVNLETGECDYDAARAREKRESKEELDEILMEQWTVWAEFVPDAVIADFRRALGDTLTPDPVTTKALAEVEVDPETEAAYPEPVAVADIHDSDIALSFVRRWLRDAVQDWLVALGLNEEEPDDTTKVLWLVEDLDQVRTATISNARPLRSLDGDQRRLAEEDFDAAIEEAIEEMMDNETQEDFVLVDGP